MQIPTMEVAAVMAGLMPIRGDPGKPALRTGADARGDTRGLKGRDQRV